MSGGVLGWQHDFTYQLLYKHHEVWPAPHSLRREESLRIRALVRPVEALVGGRLQQKAKVNSALGWVVFRSV